LRGVESLEDQRFVGELCRDLGVDFYTQSVDIRNERVRGESIEETARRVRFTNLLTTSEAMGYNKIATGHTLDDNIETILFRLISGTGPTGFSGIQPQQGRLIHPLLCVTKDQILHFLHTENARYRIDRSNLSEDFYRNRIRHSVIPLLKDINSKYREHIMNFARIVGEEDNLLKSQAEEALRKAIRTLENGKIAIHVETFQKLPDALKRRIIISCVQKLTSTDAFFKQSYLPFNIVDRLARNDLKRNNILYNSKLYCIRKEYDLLLFEKKIVIPAFQKYLYTVQRSEKMVHIHEIGGCINFSLHERIVLFEKNSIYLDYDVLDFPMYIRNRRKGDRIELDKIGRKKIKEIFINDKLPRNLREAVPILVSKIDIVGVFCSLYGKHNRVANNYKVTDKTKRVLVCELAGCEFFTPDG
jgi:tRNA(Ile)-lysidine synthase